MKSIRPMWIADGNPQDREIEELASLPMGSIVVNLFAGGPETLVRMRIDDGAWQSLAHTAMAAPTVLRSRLRNQQGYLQSKYARRSPHRNAPHRISGQDIYPRVRRRAPTGYVSKPETQRQTAP
ncbi:MAG: hypothetical protein ACLUNS_10355 [Alistipes shahii]